MKKGEKLTHQQVCDRIHLAVTAIQHNAADTVKLHNLLAPGRVKLEKSDKSRSTYICVTGDE